MKIIKALSLGLISISLSGCVSVFPEPGDAPKRIILAPKVIAPPDRKKVNKAIAVEMPIAAEMLATNRIRVRNSKGEITTFDSIAGVELQDRLPIIMQKHIAQALAASKKFTASGYNEESFKRDYVLSTEIQAFDIVIADDKNFAEVVISNKLLKNHGRDVIWQRVTSGKEPIEKHTLANFITSLKSAYEKVLYQLVQEVN